mmetsp:Transcript_19899/g.50617  ORF Transcript_19899/g.50617 Transcript_19899/m.50617 type:complete len:110 (-) Transcript_19899:844-1173(-)
MLLFLAGRPIPMLLVATREEWCVIRALVILVVVILIFVHLWESLATAEAFAWRVFVMLDAAALGVCTSSLSVRLTATAATAPTATGALGSVAAATLVCVDTGEEAKQLR